MRLAGEKRCTEKINQLNNMIAMVSLLCPVKNDAIQRKVMVLIK